jgi:hypothetical protein
VCDTLFYRTLEFFSLMPENFLVEQLDWPCRFLEALESFLCYGMVVISVVRMGSASIRHEFRNLL